MILNSYERIWFSPDVTVLSAGTGEPLVPQPPYTAYSASFDNGLTWLPARNNGGKPGWLIAGVNYITSDGMTDAVISTPTTPLVRLTDNPETLVNCGITVHLGC